MMHLPLIILITLKCAISQDEEYETVTVKLQLADYDLTDAYDEISDAAKLALLGHGYADKVFAEQSRAQIMRPQAIKIDQFGGDIPYYIERNWTLLTKLGDMLLPENEYNSLITFHNENEKLANYPAEINVNSQSTLTKQDYIDILALNRNASYLNETWSTWQNKFLDNQTQFDSILQLVNNAYIPNEQHNAKSYWEMLSEHEDGYKKAQQLWEEIRPLYKKLHDFVKLRLYNYYNITNQNDSTIPVYLLGSNFGNDWSNIAPIVLPHPYLYNEVTTELTFHTVKEIYALAENATKTMGFPPFGKKFWTKSNFNYSSCGPHLFTHCGKYYSEILTCKKLGWNEYLDIHETSVNMALNNRDFDSLARRGLRFSAIDEALKGVGAIIAIDNLPLYDFVPENAFKEENSDTYNRKITALLLMALRILPKIPYYLLADTFRLQLLEFNDGKIAEKWWKKRGEMQGIRGNTNLEPDFLGDPYINSNKPHLSNFFAIFLQFQIVENYQKFFSTENGTLASFFGNDENFLVLINDRPNRNWLELISYHSGIDAISASPLLDYFKPLEEYLASAPLKQVILSTTARPRPTKPSKLKGASVKTANKVAPDGNILQNITQWLSSANDNSNNKTSMKNDTTAGLKTIKKDATEENVESASYEKIYIISGIAGVICAGIVVFVIVRKLRRKQRSRINNRRFET